MPYKDFPDMGDAPTNNGFTERDWDEVRPLRYPDEENEREDGVVVENNNGQFNCQNTPLP